MRGAATLFAVVFASTALAQPSMDESLDEEARALFAAGRAAFGADRFIDALTHFQAAYDRSRRPELLYNVALAADRLGRAELALETYEKYLDSVPDSPFTAQANDRIAALRLRLQVQVDVEPEPDPEPPPEPQIRIVETPNATPQPEPVAMPVDPDPEPVSNIPAFVVLGGGAASLLAGLVLVVTGQSARSNVEGSTSPIWTAELDGDYDAAIRQTATGIVLLGVGAVAATSGLLMLLLRRTRTEAVSLDFGPGGIDMRGRF